MFANARHPAAATEPGPADAVTSAPPIPTRAGEAPAAGGLFARLVAWANEPAAPPSSSRPEVAVPERVIGLVASRPIVADALLALLVVGITVPQLVSHPDLHGNAAVYVAIAALVVPLVWRRRYPVAVFSLTWAVGVTLLFAGHEVVADLAVLIALYTVANGSPRRVAAGAAAATELGVIVGTLLHLSGRNPGLELTYLSAFVAGAFLLGINVRTRREYLMALVDRAHVLEHLHEQEARMAAATERAGIAREMHDIVAHSVAVMVTMADAAARKGRSEPERAVAAMNQVSQTGRQTLDETRRLLGVLRTETSGEARFMPHPGLAQLDALLDHVRATGLNTKFTVSGEPFDVLEGAQLAAYRIVQEALTNTLKHAQGARCAEVRLHYAKPVMEIEVTDDGHARPEGSLAPGHGLTGMKERASIYGGTLVAGRGPCGGWSVSARLDLAAAL